MSKLSMPRPLSFSASNLRLGANAVFIKRIEETEASSMNSHLKGC